MTDRVKGFTVTLTNDVRIDDIESLVNAVKMLKGVASVDLSISNSEDWMNRERVKYEIRDKFLNFYTETFK